MSLKIYLKTKEILQILISREELTSSDLGALVSQSLTDNLNSKVLRSMTHPLIQASKNFHKLLDKTIMKRDTLRDNYTIVILLEDKKMKYTLVPDSEIMATMVEEGLFPEEWNDTIVIIFPLKNKNQSYRKLILSAVYNIDIQGEAENILSSRLDNAKVRHNMAEMQHSWAALFLWLSSISSLMINFYLSTKIQKF